MTANPIYEKNRTLFRSQLKNEPARAYEVFGLTLLYSLQPDEMLNEKRRLGVPSSSPIDLYNQGVLANRRQSHADAVRYYEAAEKAGGQFSELYYNMGLTYEALSQKAKAVKAFEKFLKVVGDQGEIHKHDLREIRARIKKLKG